MRAWLKRLFRTDMGWVTALVFAALWFSLAAWVWATGGNTAYGLALAVLAVGFVATAIVQYRRQRPVPDDRHVPGDH